MSETGEADRLFGPSRVCTLRLEADPVLGWTLRLGPIDPNWKAALHTVIKRWGSHGRRDLAKRVITETPEAENTLEELGLS